MTWSLADTMWRSFGGYDDAECMATTPSEAPRAYGPTAGKALSLRSRMIWNVQVLSVSVLAFRDMG